MECALILIGAPGSGKSSVLDALSTLLEIDGVQFGAIETEELARGWPWLKPEQWIPQLSAMIELQRQTGRQRFLVVATTETDHELEAVIGAVRAERVIVVCLAVPPDLAASRVSEREPDAWPGKPPLVEHARKLAGVIPSLERVETVISTVDRQPIEIATELRDLLAAEGVV